MFEYEELIDALKHANGFLRKVRNDLKTDAQLALSKEVGEHIDAALGILEKGQQKGA